MVCIHFWSVYLLNLFKAQQPPKIYYTDSWKSPSFNPWKWVQKASLHEVKENDEKVKKFFFSCLSAWHVDIKRRVYVARYTYNFFGTTAGYCIYQETQKNTSWLAWQCIESGNMCNEMNPSVLSLYVLCMGLYYMTIYNCVELVLRVNCNKVYVGYLLCWRET